MAVIGVALLLVQVIPGSVALAGESTPSSTTQTLAMPEITLEKAILIVKTNFDVPIEYTDFNSSYNTNGDRQVWSLRWNGTAGRQGELAAEVSATNGDILSMYTWKSDGQSSHSGILPTITKSKAQEITADLLTRLLGERAGQLRPISSDQVVVPLGNNGPINYALQYQRVINDLPFLSNGVKVQVSGTDGHITSYNLNWSEVKAPEVKGVINVAQAQKAFATAPFFKLKYWVANSYRTLAVGQKKEAKLVYELAGQSGGAIDALTGLPLQLALGDSLAIDLSGSGGMGAKGSGGSPSSNDVAVVITPQEQQEVEKTALLLKRDEAIAAVKRWIGIPDNLTLRSANLGTDWRNTDQRVWNFDWNATGAKDGQGAQSLSARVSATTGELLGFNLYYAQAEKTKVKLDRAEMQTTAEEFLKKVQPDRFSQSTLDIENNFNAKIGTEPWNIQGFSYHRVANGVDFLDNGMTVSVAPQSGLVTSYELNWSEFNLPSVSGILSKDKAAELFLKARPMTLAYVRIYTNGLPGNNLRLVYLPFNQDTSIPLSNILDAKTGELLDYQGQPLEKGPKPYHFTDLTGVNGAQEIAALGEAGLFGEFGGKFKPQEKMSITPLLRAMYLSRFGLWGNTGLTDAEIIIKAKEQGWLKENLQPGDQVDRELLAKVLVRYVQLNKVAELKDIYKVNFQDAADIDPDALGYIALANSTGILKVEGQILAPRDNVIRAEAATALFRALGWHS